MRTPLDDLIFQPSISLLFKLGRIAVHADELLSPERHTSNAFAMRTLLDDKEVQDWLRGNGFNGLSAEKTRIMSPRGHKRKR